MKIKSFKLIGTLVILVLMVCGANAFVTRIAAAHTVVAAGDLQQIEDFQGLAQADAGYASSVAELVSVTTEVSNPFPTRPGRRLIVVASSNRQHFVAATKLPDGAMLVRSDEHRNAITCASYTPGCIAAITADPSLINATPSWETY